MHIGVGTAWETEVYIRQLEGQQTYYSHKSSFLFSQAYHGINLHEEYFMGIFGDDYGQHKRVSPTIVLKEFFSYEDGQHKRVGPNMIYLF